MSVRFAINGLGRIGRALVRLAFERPELDLELVAANDLAERDQVVHLLRHDTIHRHAPRDLRALDDGFEIAGQRVRLFHADRPEDIAWERAGVAIVVEATGRFRRRELAAGHLVRPGVQLVLVSATLPDADCTVCMGHNQQILDPVRHRVVSGASCTTHCLAAVLAVLDGSFGVRRALMNTVHCVTNSQNLVDMAHPDLRRARSAIGNLIPTTSDAVPSIGWVLPRLAGRVTGYAVRVPIAAGSLLDVVVELERNAAPEEVEAAYREAAAGPLAGILALSEEPLVSSDFIDSPYSATVDLPLLQAAGPRLLRVVAWYDNEWGYSNRLAELVAAVGARLSVSGTEVARV